MMVLAMAGILACWPPPPEDEALPLSLSGDDLSLGVRSDPGPEGLPRELFLEPPQAAKKDVHLAWWLGGHLGVAVPFDGDAGFLIGFQARVDILDWLSAEASLDFHRDTFESGDIRVDEFPLQVTALFHPQVVDWPVQPYGLAGFGLYYTDIHFKGNFANINDRHDIHGGFHLGGGVNYAVTPQITLDAEIRFVFVEGGVQGDSFHYFQFTVGINFRLTPP